MNRVLSDTVPQTASVNVTTSFLYNPSGTIQQVTDPGLRQTTFDYDASDQKKTMTYPGEIQSQSWTYDDVHNLMSRTTVGGKVEQFTYDIRNRKDTMTCKIPNPLTWIEWADYGYDAASHLTLAKIGTLAWNTNVISTITRQYDDAGRLTLDQQNVNGLGIKNVYYPLHDADGKLIRMYVGGASPVYDYTFDYDDMGRFETIKPTGGSAVFQYHYDAASNEVQRDNLQNGVQQIYPRTVSIACCT
jgi:YD repeat-containing protein